MAPWSTAVHGVVLSQTMGLFECRITTGQAMLTSDFQLSGDGIVIF
jgi:hypothetical protein